MRTLSSTTFVMISSALLMASLTAPAAAKTCKSWGFIGQASASTKPQALVLARLNWAVKVTDQWGVPWRNWNIASSKWEFCEAVGQKQSCMAVGNPCKP